MITYKNGNAEITLQSNGSRVISFKSKLNLDFPLNLDIRISDECSLGLNIKTGKSFCSFCHESATTKGKECNYTDLQEILKDLPKGIELAIGCNKFTFELYNFLTWCYDKEFVCNLTINQGHCNRDSYVIEKAIENNLIKGLGISYRRTLKWDIPNFILNYSNAVFHVIIGIDTIEDVLELKNKKVKKILCLGEKNFGFNKDKVDLNSIKHKKWYWYVRKLFDNFEIVSFDNLALEQLNIKRFLTDKDYEIFNQKEYSFYIDATKEIFKPSSRSKEFVSWNDVSIKDYFKQLIK